MTKLKTNFSCIECGYVSPKWLGKCPECFHWNSFQEEVKRDLLLKNSLKHFDCSEPKSVLQIELIERDRIQTQNHEFDRVMGGGVTIGSVTLIGGEPGIGKSTLLMDVCGKLTKLNQEHKILYVSGEESEVQVAQRAKRLQVVESNILIFHETDWVKIEEQLKKIKPKYLVLDSIQTTSSGELDSVAGSPSQVREVTHALVNYAKINDLTCFVIGHITKEGSLAGPKILEHMVDTVIYFEGDQKGQYRLLRVVKNRFGNTNEVGVFEMKQSGLVEVSNPSFYFLEHNSSNSFGRSITTILEGTRNLIIEIQALVVENKFNVGRRTTQGFDSSRLSLLLAVIDKYFSIPISLNDIYVNVVGGLKISSREADLAVIASLLSSYFGISLPADCIFLGEVGLIGEVRPVSMIELRLKEISLLNYKKIITSKINQIELQNKLNLEVIGIVKAAELKHLLFNKS